MPETRTAPISGVRRLTLAAAAALMLAACGGGASESEGSGGSAAPASEASGSEAGGGGGGEATTVNIVDNDFEPAETQVAAGGEVTWENTGETAHTVTFEDGEDSGNLDSGANYSRTFDEAGDFPYVCSIHPSMQGTVTAAE